MGGWFESRNAGSNPDDSSMSYAVAVGNLLENDFFYRPNRRLGWRSFSGVPDLYSLEKFLPSFLACQFHYEILSIQLAYSKPHPDSFHSRGRS